MSSRVKQLSTRQLAQECKKMMKNMLFIFVAYACVYVFMF